MSDRRLLRVFLCHASRDKPKVRGLYKRLKEFGVDPWLDEEKLIPGQNWRSEIHDAVKKSDVVIVCLTDYSISKEGYVQKEIRYALDVADEKPENTIFLIPARFEQCEIPNRLKKWQCVDLFNPENFSKLQEALRTRAEAVNVTIKPKSSNSESFSPDTPFKASGLSKILSFLPRSKSILCPYCLAKIHYVNRRIGKCPNCKNKLHFQYVLSSDYVSPIVIQLLGEPASGKTVYLQTLYLLIKNLCKIWPNYESGFLSESRTIMSYLRDVWSFESRGELPPPTLLGYNDPLIIGINQIPRWGNQILIFRDDAGQGLEDFLDTDQGLNYLIQMPTIFFMFDLYHPEGNPDYVLYTLRTYIDELINNGINPSQRNIIVIFSKADLCSQLKVRRYLIDDPLQKLLSNNDKYSVDISDYMRKVYMQSDIIKDWFVNSFSIRNELNRLTNYGDINLYFSMVSSLGCQPYPENYLVVDPKPHRVIDPLFLALDLNSEKTFQ